MRRPVPLLALLIVGAAAAVWFSPRPLPSVLTRLLGGSRLFHTKTIEVEGDPVRNASTRLLKPFGFVRLTHVLQESKSSSSPNDAVGAPRQLP
jgi:hypothetical protein